MSYVTSDMTLLRQKARLPWKNSMMRYLVNSCYVSRDMEVRKVTIRKRELRGHSRTLGKVPFDRQHISLPLQLRLPFFTVSKILSLLPKL